MVIDTSVLLALVFNEAKAPWCADLLNAHSGKSALLVCSLSDIIKSKKAANRSKDRAVLDILTKTLDEKNRLKPES